MTEKRKAVAVALTNNKGGVGKTTTAISLAAGLAAGKRRVLLVDLDAQGSASLSLGLTRDALSPGTADAILGGKPIRTAIRSTSVEGLDVLPGSMALASADVVLAGVAGRELVLKKALVPVLADYDLIVLDCPPSLGLLTVNALTAADFFVVPVTPDYLALEGLVNFMDAVEKIRAGIGHAAQPLGILLTLADYRLNVTGEIRDLLRGYYGRLVFRTEVPINVRLKEAPSFGKTILDYDARSSGADAYRELTREVLARINRITS